MSIITRVSVHSYTYALDNFATLMRYQKGAKLDLTKFVTVIETDDGLRGEYAPHYMANAKTCAQVIEMAPLLLGRDAEMPAPIRGKPPPAASIASEPTQILLNTALSWGIPLLRFTASGTAPPKVRST